MTSIKEALKASEPIARLDAEVLLAHVLSCSRTYLYTHPEKKLNTLQIETYRDLLTQRTQGIPVAYLTSLREFYSFMLKVSKDTLIPRPETELLVELALSFLAPLHHLKVLDLGTGSGAVALALASLQPDWQIYGSDTSVNALKIAKENAEKLHLSNIEWICSDWFSSLPNIRFDAILSNPPYVAENDPHLKLGDVQFEPQNALVSGPQGLDALTHIIQNSHKKLAPNGLLLLEHGHTQAQDVTTLLIQHGYERVATWQDIQGLDRVSGGFIKK